VKAKRACTICSLLKECKRVTEKMLEEGDYCNDWLPVSEAQQRARDIIKENLGPAALRYEVDNLNIKSAATVKPRRRKRHV